MRRITTIAALLLTLATMTTPAVAMQPPGEGARDNFGCVDGEDQPVAGHPGAAGLTHAAPRVRELTGDSLPTAWNAVEKADPIDFGEC